MKLLITIVHHQRNRIRGQFVSKNH